MGLRKWLFSGSSSDSEPEKGPPRKSEPTPEEIFAAEFSKSGGIPPGLAGLYQHYYSDPRWLERAPTRPTDYVIANEDPSEFWAAARAFEKKSLDEHLHQAEIKTLQVIPNSQDGVALDTTEALLKNLARAIPVWLTYSLIGTRQQSYCAFTAPAQFIEQLQAIILTYFPNTG